MATSTESKTAPNDSITITPDEADVEAFAEKVFDRLLGAMDSYSIHIGNELGWYKALAGQPPMTSGELAAATSSDERYAREWLEQQTVSGFVNVIDATESAEERRYVLPPEAAEVLANPDSLAYMAPFPSLASALGVNMDKLTEAFRTGAGVGWHEHGEAARCGQADANRPMFMQLLGQEYLPQLPGVHEALHAGGSVADVGCGLGWSSIGVAHVYPDAKVDGYDIDEPSIGQARSYAADEGVADRVTFHTVDVADVDGDGYDLVMALECVHDMADPVSVLRAMRNMVKPDGTVMVMDERVGEKFTGEDDPVERMFYGFSLMCCLADGRNAPTSVATGTVMRPDTLREYALDAGFDELTITPIENDFFRFYILEHSD